MANIYDTANQMATDLKASQQYQDLKKSYDLLKLDAVGYALFQQFQEKQMGLQQQQMQGQELSNDDLADLQALGEKMQTIDTIKDLLAKEQALSQMMDELNRTIAQPIMEIYQGS